MNRVSKEVTIYHKYNEEKGRILLLENTNHNEDVEIVLILNNGIEYRKYV